MRKALIIIVVALGAVSCVSTKTFNSMRAEVMRLENDLAQSTMREGELALQNRGLTDEKNSLEQQIATLNSRITALNAENARLDENYKQLLSNSSDEAARMLEQLEQNQRELNMRSARVEELENLLRAREEAIDDIRRKVANALLGFDGKGLTISTRDGNVYVSMDDKLLFRSGSFEIETNGATAVRDLAVVLAQNPDINIMVEGHTDDVPYRGSGNLKDNLDLSVKRATTVTRLLLENRGIDPSRIISAGRGEYLPVAEGQTTEARALNRRTEIILSPKIDELMNLLDR